MSGEKYHPGALSAFLGGGEEEFKKKKKARRKRKASALDDDATKSLFDKTSLEKVPELPDGETIIQSKKVKLADLPPEDDDAKNSSATEDVADKKKKKPRKKNGREEKSYDLEDKQRTVFVGNAPLSTKRKEIRKLFSKFGLIESVRLRSLVSSNEKLTKKVVAIKKEYSENMHSVNFYVKFKDPASVMKALSMNGEKLGGHTLRVDTCLGRRDYSQKTTVFVGNLPFDVDEEQLHEYFSKVGDVKLVRIVRDQKSGTGKGFGFVGFSSDVSVPLALKLDGSVFREREIRVKTIEKKKKRLAKAAASSKKEAKKTPKKDRQMKKTGKRISSRILSTKRSATVPDKKDGKKRLTKKVRKLIKKRNSSNKKTIMK